jgi:hypothetical protein
MCEYIDRLDKYLSKDMTKEKPGEKYEREKLKERRMRQ